jgi:hypothetical protein
MALGPDTAIAPTAQPAREPSLEDPEKQAASRRGSRWEKQGDGLSDTDSGLSVGAQIELEKHNAIQYRTCGWKKV